MPGADDNIYQGAEDNIYQRQRTTYSREHRTTYIRGQRTTYIRGQRKTYIRGQTTTYIREQRTTYIRSRGQHILGGRGQHISMPVQCGCIRLLQPWYLHLNGNCLTFPYHRCPYSVGVCAFFNHGTCTQTETVLPFSTIDASTVWVYSPSPTMVLALRRKLSYLSLPSMPVWCGCIHPL